MHNFIKKGFTLIELLVTIGILAVVAAGVVALINPQDKLRQASDAKVLNDIGQIATAVQSYAAQNATGRYPSTVAELQTEINQVPAAPNGYTYTSTYDAVAPVGETFVITGDIQSNRMRTSVDAVAGLCTAASCFWRFEAGNAVTRFCYRVNATTACP